ncbi:MAG: hypothetical protein M3527_01105 [Actinomycetota bacterium]|nr:hypothetical protein [Acidimicrobiia bacterium]MDQ3293039.1 hypothetical protein [Actinomycetota bacterium]
MAGCCATATSTGTAPQLDLAARPAALIANADLTVLSDERKRFACPMESKDDADVLVDSLYPAGVAPARIAARAAVRAR